MRRKILYDTDPAADKAMAVLRSEMVVTGGR